MSEKVLKRIRFPLLAVIIGGAFALRFNLAVKAFFSTFDTSTVGVMALRILQDGERPLFYYGQDYMGALEAYTTAFFFALFGPSTTVLSLAPTLYALGWILATYLLFAEIFGVAGGLAAALSAAACGWYSLWFTMASYGGYPETFLFGTLFLWLVVRICHRSEGPGERFAAAAAAGVVAAVGIWTNFQVFSYLVTGALAAAPLLTKRERRRRLIPPLILAAGIALCGFIPLGACYLRTEHATDHYALGAPLHLPTNIKMFFAAMAHNFSWPETVVPGLREAALLSYAGVVILGLRGLPAKLREQPAALVPLLFVPVFLALFVLHPKAGTGAPRYTIPLMTMGTGLLFAAAVSLGRRALRSAAWVLITVWTAFNVLSALATTTAQGKEADVIRQGRREIVTAAEGLGLRHVEIVGSEIDGLAGQTLTFFAGDRVRFVGIINDRHLRSAEEADRDDTTGLLCKEEHFAKVRDSLSAAGVSFRRRQVGTKVLLYDLEPPRDRYQSLPPREMAVAIAEGPFADKGRRLIDRSIGTDIGGGQGGNDSPFVIDVALTRVAAVGGLTLFAPFPYCAAGSFAVSGSQDGKEFFPLGGDMNEILPVGHGGNRVFIMRPFNAVELRFPAQRVKYLRIRVRPERNRLQDWHLGELLVLERIGEGSAVPAGEVEALRAALLERGVSFCAADPWLSARLNAPPRSVPAYRRYNRRYRVTRISRNLIPRPGLAFAVDETLADEAAVILAGATPEGLVLGEELFGHYRLFTFDGRGAADAAGTPTLTWNDQMVLRTGSSARPEDVP